MNDTKNQRKNVFKKLLTVLEITIITLIVLICTVILTQRLSNNETSFLGFRLFKVETGSMIPKYNINDVLLVKETNPDEIKIGDDITYLKNEGQYGDVLITHQVIDIIEKNGVVEFYTKGIANNISDPVVFGSQIVGVVKFKSFILTFITNILSNIYSFYFVIIVPMVISLFFREIHSKDRKERYLEKRRQEIQEEREQEKKKEQKTQENNTKRKRGQVTDTKTKRNDKNSSATKKSNKKGN